MKQKHENIIIQIIPFFFCAIVFFTTIHCSSKLKWTVFWKKLVFITPRSRWCHSCFCFYIDAKPFFTIIIKYHLKITEALEDTVHIWSCRVLEAISLVCAECSLVQYSSLQATFTGQIQTVHVQNESTHACAAVHVSSFICTFGFALKNRIFLRHFAKLQLKERRQIFEPNLEREIRD